MTPHSETLPQCLGEKQLTQESFSQSQRGSAFDQRFSIGALLKVAIKSFTVLRHLYKQTAYNFLSRGV